MESSNTIIWINGPFGGGKTQTAHELHHRLPGSAVCDPELVGNAIQRTIPEGRSTDFQDMPVWRDATRRVLTLAVQQQRSSPLIVPMTMVVPEYFREIVGGLRDSGISVHHFALVAPREVIVQRLRRRLDHGDSWPARQLDRCLNALVDPLFAEQIETADKSIKEVAEEIAARSNLILRPASDGLIRTRLRRLRVQTQHIRWIHR